MHGRVVSTTYLTPALVRVVLEGGDLAGLEMPDATDAYVNVAFRPAGATYDEVFDPQAVRDSHPAGRSSPPGGATPSVTGSRRAPGSRSTSSSTATAGWPAPGRRRRSRATSWSSPAPAAATAPPPTPTGT